MVIRGEKKRVVLQKPHRNTRSFYPLTYPTYHHFPQSSPDLTQAAPSDDILAASPMQTRLDLYVIYLNRRGPMKWWHPQVRLIRPGNFTVLSNITPQCEWCWLMSSGLKLHFPALGNESTNGLNSCHTSNRIIQAPQTIIRPLFQVTTINQSLQIRHDANVPT